MEQNTQFAQQDVEATKGLAWLSYIGILFLVPMLVNKDSQYTKFHVNQGIVLFIFEIVAGIASGILSFIPFIGWMISGLLSLALLVLAILGIVNSLQGNAKPLPVIGNIVIYK